MQRRVEQADGDGQAVHRLEDALEVGALQLRELLERGALLRLVVGEDEPLHERQAVAQEHVLGAAEADALGAEPARHVRRRAGRSALVRTFIRRKPSAQPRRVSNGPPGSGVTTGTAPTTTSPVVPLIEMTSPSCTIGAVRPSNRPALDVDVELARAAHRGRAHAAGDDRGVAHQPAARREDALGRDHAVQVVGRGLRPHQDDVLAVVVVLLGGVGGEVHLADRGAGRRVQALGDRGVRRRRVELRVQELVELRRLHAQHRLALVDEAFAPPSRRPSAARRPRCACRRGSAGGTADPARW